MDCSDSADILPCTCYDRLAFVTVNRSCCTRLLRKKKVSLVSDRKSQLRGSCKDDKVLSIV